MCVQGAAERIRLVGAAEAGAAEARGRAEATLLLDDKMMIFDIILMMMMMMMIMK